MKVVEFARMVLQEFPWGREAMTFHPSPNQVSYMDNMGIEPIEWESGIGSKE